MAFPQTADREELYKMIESLPEDDTEKVLSYVAFLKYIQHLEDEEDRRIILDRQDEATIPFDDVKKELGLV